ncbi:MAG: hypothetical protein JWS12_564 [Candidatus Saccharibacteria bacterium]|nr:hypothetical protein [Candidatus Saccharibacteria bacterium]
MDDSLRILLDDVPQLDLVPEIVIGSIKHHGGLALAEDRGSFDYVYFLKKLADMSGKKYKNKRNLFNSTKEILGSRLETTTTNTITPSLQQEMLAIFRAWEKHSTQPIQKVRLEYIAINRLLSNSDHFNLHLTLCRIDGKLNGFSIHEVINKTYTLCHFEKSLNDVYLGAGVVLINEAAQSLVKKSKIVNWEQDLGLSGLKKAKQSYVPTKYFKKYWISRGA